MASKTGIGCGDFRQGPEKQAPPFWVKGSDRFLQDDTVFPALECMTAKFQVQIILFSEIKKWGCWHVGGTHFISVGPASSDEGLGRGLLKNNTKETCFEIMRLG